MATLKKLPASYLKCIENVDFVNILKKSIGLDANRLEPRSGPIDSSLFAILLLQKYWYISILIEMS